MFLPEAASFGEFLYIYSLRKLLRYLPVWTMRHGHFLIMGGFHLVEPAKGNSTRPHDVEKEGMFPSPIDGADAEKGNKAEVEPGRVTVLTLDASRTCERFGFQNSNNG